LRFEGSDDEIDITAGGTMKPEFDDWRWARLEEVPQLALAFKRPVYEAVAEQFAEYARPLAEAGAA
jgi:putative (di)nucleoside polyphosphate hydrolase